MRKLLVAVTLVSMAAPVWADQPSVAMPSGIQPAQRVVVGERPVAPQVKPAEQRKAATQAPAPSVGQSINNHVLEKTQAPEVSLGPWLISDNGLRSATQTPEVSLGPSIMN